MTTKLWIPFTTLWLLVNMVFFFSYEVVVFVAFWPWNRRLYREYMGSIQTAWVDVIATSFYKTDIIATGQLPSDPTKPAIILCNHQIDADWWFLWELVRRVGGGGNLKITLKDELKYVPVFGWGLLLFEFLFVKRNVEHDRRHVTQHMQRFVQENFPFWMLIFPEGTTIHSEYVEKSHRFAKSSNRPHLERLLLPRTAGLETMLAAAANAKPDIYDLTMAYPSYSGEVPTYKMGYSRKVDTQVPSMAALLTGAETKQVHIHGQKYSFDQVFGKEQQFLDQAWVEKEDLLNDFIQNKCFNSKQEQFYRKLAPKTSFGVIFRLWGAAALAIVLFPAIAVVAAPCYAVMFLKSLIFSSKKVKSV